MLQLRTLTLGSLADILGVSERTVRLWEEKGKTEKTKIKGGRVYYRLVEQAPDLKPEPGWKSASEAVTGNPNPDPITTLVEHHRQVMALNERHSAEIMELYDRLTKVQIAKAETQLIAEAGKR